MKLTQYKNPVSGQQGDVLNAKSWYQLILGGSVLLLVWKAGGYVADEFMKAFKQFTKGQKRETAKETPSGDIIV